MVNEKFIGSSFESFLEQEKIAGEVNSGAIKKIISYQLEDALKKANISKTEFASRMNTSRAAVNRLLNPANDSVTLQTLAKAASALGKRLTVTIG